MQSFRQQLPLVRVTLPGTGDTVMLSLRRFGRLPNGSPLSGLWRTYKPLLKKHQRTLLLFPVIALVMALTGWGVLLLNLAEEREALQRDALQEAEILSRAHARQLNLSLEAVDQLTLYAKYGWEISGGNLRLEDISSMGMFGMDSGIFITIFDENGNLLTSTIPNAPKTNVFDEPYFQAQREAPGRFYIGTAKIGRVSKTAIVPFSRRLSDQQGNFGGVVVASVVPGHFMSSYDEMVLGEAGLIAIMTTDHQVRLARIGSRIFLPGNREQALVGKPAFDQDSGSALLRGDQWFADGRNRYTSWQTTSGYGMLTLAGLDEGTVLRRYAAIHDPAIRNALFSSLALTLLTVIAMIVFLGVVQRKERFKAMQASYRLATEGAAEGFLIATPLMDAQGKVVDFSVVDCNERGAQFFGHRREDLLNRFLAPLFPGKKGRLLLRLLRLAMTTSRVERDIEVGRWRLDGPAWLNVRIIFSDGNLALTMRDISESKAHLAELERRGNEDALTGLPNRHWVNSYLPEAVARAAEAGQQLGLLFIDLDEFKVINDTLGHEAGDDTLRVVGQRLRSAVRPHDHVVRIGGDEFLVLLEPVRDPADAADVANRILEAFRVPVRTPVGVHTVGTSIGISIFPHDGKEANTLLNNADVAMYSAKASGKRMFAFYDPDFSDALRARHQLQLDLIRALEADQLVVWYQPRLDTITGATTSFEALVRWNHPARGLLGPGEFIPLAEETGLISRVGEAVVRKVCAQVASWRQHDLALAPVSVNVSAHQFRNTDVGALFASCLQQYRVAPELIEIELTESAMVDDSEAVAQTLAALRKLGVKLLVDDFGTGYSSLSQLQRLRFDVLKVDRAFTCQLEASREGFLLFRAIITMAHELGMRVVAEGVENAGQLKILRSLQCDEVQGFYLSKPVPPAATQAELHALAVSV